MRQKLSIAVVVVLAVVTLVASTGEIKAEELTGREIMARVYERETGEDIRIPFRSPRGHHG